MRRWRSLCRNELCQSIVGMGCLFDEGSGARSVELERHEKGGNTAMEVVSEESEPLLFLLWI